MSHLNKRGIVADYLPWLLISLAILFILFIFIFVLKGKGESIIDNLRGVFRR